LVMDVCSAGFSSFVNSSVLQISVIASIASAALITLSFYIGQIINNPKITVWAKSEYIQLVVSVASVALLIMTINMFCAIDMGSVASVFGITGAPSGVNMYNASTTYLNNTLSYSHDALVVVRYHLQAFTVLSHLSSFACDFKLGAIGMGCLFGYSGTSEQPFGAFNAAMGALNLFFNSALVAYMTTLSFLFVLIYIYKGFVLFLLPIGIFVRSLPYMRSFGSLIIALALSFMIIFPMILSIFGLMSGVLFREPDMAQYMDEEVFPDNGGALSSGVASWAGATMGSDYFACIYFSDGSDCGTVAASIIPIFAAPGSTAGGGSNIPGAISFAAYAFIAGVFLPTAALLATIASVTYLARLYGEEIDLNRIIQMV